MFSGSRDAGAQELEIVQELIKSWITPEGCHLDELRSKRLLQTAGIRVADTLELGDSEEVVRATKALGYPMQVSAVVREWVPDSLTPRISLMVCSEAEARRSCEEIMVNLRQWNPSVEVQGFSVREAPRNSIEFRITVEQDPVLGRIMAAGYGRMAMEIWGDVAYRVLPLSKRDPHLMLAELKGTRLASGYRHIDNTNISYIEELVMRVSDFVDGTPEILTMDLDPIYANRRQVAVYGARIQLHPQREHDA
ncbi:MAG: acetyl-CoA synthetase [Dehalococcoidia bacterium]|nr:acetyl-CoA synthetase [Dehalococcoidia bacterium]